MGSEQRIATLILHFARRGEHVTVAYVGRTNRHEHAQFARFLACSPNLEGVTRRAGLAALWQVLRKRLQHTWRPGSSGRARATGFGNIADQDSPARRAFVQSVIEEHRPRIVIVEFLRLTYTVHPRGPTTGTPGYWIDTHDVLHKRAERYRAAGATVTHDVLAAQEVRGLETYDAILAIQKPESDVLRHLVQNRPVIVVPHGIELPTLPERIATDRRTTRLGFLGGRDESNGCGLDWFVNEIWPKLRSEFGDGVELHIAGQVCHTWQQHHDGIVSIGPVKTIDLFWPNIDVAINPVRFGSGLKIKNVEALAYGRPLITTSIGAEGLEEASPNGLRIADTKVDWARSLDEWLANPDAATKVGRAGRVYAEAHLTEEAAFHDLASLIANTVPERQP